MNQNLQAKIKSEVTITNLVFYPCPSTRSNIPLKLLILQVHNFRSMC